MKIIVEMNSVFKYYTEIKTAKQHDEEYKVGHLGIVGGSVCGEFQPNKTSTSATVCINCGREKFEHQQNVH